MGVTTKAGDRGSTTLHFNRKARKDGPRIEAVGAIDELLSMLGLARSSARKASVKKLLCALQEDLLIMASEVATLPRDVGRLRFSVDASRLERVEKQTESLAAKAKLNGPGFFIPGESRSGALLDVCRTVARRVERRVVPLCRKQAVPNLLILAYLNRLSDLLFYLARLEEPKHRRFTPR